jgi:pimeloyl-ACP methyl ester carboxylesterase
MSEASRELSFEVHGMCAEGRVPLLIMHGWGNTKETVRPLSDQLSSYTQTVAIDLPGHGQSAVPNSVWSMTDFSEAVAHFLEQRGLTKVDIVGHSFGGKTAIKFAAQFPDRVNKIVLIGASGLRPTGSLKRRVRMLLLRWLRWGIRFKNTRWGERVYREWYIPRFASRDYLNAGPMRAIFVKTVNEELQEELAALTVPVLLLWGSEDNESPVEVAHKMKGLIRNSRLIVLPGQGHHPFCGSGCSLVIRYIRDFLWD